MRFLSSVLAGATLLLLSSTLTAAAVADLTPPIRAEILDAVVDRLGSSYVDVDAAPLISKAIRSRQGARAYDAITNPAQFAEAVTRDLRSVNGDLHLGLRYSPEPRTPGRAATPFGDPRLVNFGMGRAEILEGNVGYLEITGFTGGAYQDAVVDALRLLSRTDALIIDVRRNGGGASDMSHFIFSHFLGENPVPTINVLTRRAVEPNRRMSLGDVPGPRRPDVPLFVLTSQGTGSAAEEFCFVLKNLGRATLVGRRTAGAGHMVARMPVGHGFTVSISVTRVSDPATGREWEGVGVQPDIAVDPEQALSAAHLAAMKLIVATADGARSGSLRRVIEAVEAEQKVADEAPSVLARFAGVYEGRVVSVKGGRLWYARRRGGMSERLTPMGDGLFALSAQRLRFRESAGRITLAVQQPDGTEVILNRTEGSPVS